MCAAAVSVASFDIFVVSNDNDAVHEDAAVSSNEVITLRE